MNVAVIPTIGALCGIVFGATTMSFVLKDRLTKEVEAQVTERVTIATKLARYDERLKALESAVKIPSP